MSNMTNLTVLVNKLFNKIGLDISFTRHFIDRLNDPRNSPEISMVELSSLFDKEYQAWGTEIAALSPNQQAVMTDLETDINIPFKMIFDPNRRKLVMIPKTVMRKKDFKTDDKVFTVEEIGILDAPTPTLRTIARKFNADLRYMSAQLEAGIEVEMEHTTHLDVAKEIALDHLNEFPDYYDRLDAIENKPKIFTEDDVIKMWEDHKASLLNTPYEKMLISALTMLSKEIKSDPDTRYSLDSHALNVKKAYDLDNISAKTLTKIWQHWRKTGELIGHGETVPKSTKKPISKAAI
jgi:hypothetical protein